MYSREQKQAAVETYFKTGESLRATIRILGYPNSRGTLSRWVKDYKDTGVISSGYQKRKAKFSEDQIRSAVSYYFDHGCNIRKTIVELGYPKCYQTLVKWVDQIAPRKRKLRTTGPRSKQLPQEIKLNAVADLETRLTTAKEVADRYGVARITPYIWRQELIKLHNGESQNNGSRHVTLDEDQLTKNIEELKAMEQGLRTRVRALQLEEDVRKATLEIIKKDPGTDPNRLTNIEKAQLIQALRSTYKLKDLLPMLSMAKSSYEYAVHTLAKEEPPDRTKLRSQIMNAFEQSGGTYGYRRILVQLNAENGVAVGEWSVRAIMKQLGLYARAPKKKRKWSSYAGEVSKAPKNLLRNPDGTHDFFAKKPNEKWVTDITEFHIPAGKIYLSPIIDCFDGCPLSWSISTSPNAEMANASLLAACNQLRAGENPLIHSDRGGHYRWSGWIDICKTHGLIRSMSRKGYSPDNARAEGFFGRLKVEFFYDRDWRDVSIDEFITMLDGYLNWYRNTRIKPSLGYKSPKQYRKELGLAA